MGITICQFSSWDICEASKTGQHKIGRIREIAERAGRREQARKGYQINSAGGWQAR
jgi:hypothetical protein